MEDVASGDERVLRGVFKTSLEQVDDEDALRKVSEVLVVAMLMCQVLFDGKPAAGPSSPRRRQSRHAALRGDRHRCFMAQVGSKALRR